MENWRRRLIEAIHNDGRSYRALSLDAGLGPNYVNQLLAPDSRGPTASALIKLLNVLKVSPTFIITGSPMTPEMEELLDLAARMSPESRDKLIDFLRSEQGLGQSPSSQAASAPATRTTFE